MHYHYELLIPPTDQPHFTITNIMDAYMLCDSCHNNSDAIGDWYVIGGRWAGEKLIKSLDPQKIKSYKKELKQSELRVMSVQAVKPTPCDKKNSLLADQVWRKHFPDINENPFMSDYSDQYENDLRDVWKLKDVPKNLTASGLIVTHSHHEEIICLPQSGEILKVVDEINKLDFSRYEINDDWLLATIDIHN